MGFCVTQCYGDSRADLTKRPRVIGVTGAMVNPYEEGSTMESVSEVWKAVDGIPGYEVSNCGRVRSVDRVVVNRNGVTVTLRGKVLKPARHSAGYLSVAPSLGGANLAHSLIHRLVAHAFIGPQAAGVDVNHIDGNKHNNHVSNLEYVTRKQNMMHAKDTGLWDNRGEGNGQCRATEEQIRRAYHMVASGATSKCAASATGLTLAMVNKAVTGEKWKHLGLTPLRRRSSRAATATKEQN